MAHHVNPHHTFPLLNLMPTAKHAQRYGVSSNMTPYLESPISSAILAFCRGKWHICELGC